MGKKISVVLNTLNCEREIERVLRSVQWADEILVCDMHSDDKTVTLAKQLNAKVISHKRLNFVEPARNFAISKASGEWILILDPDEEVPSSLVEILTKIAKEDQAEIAFVEIPRKNIIFGKWVKAANWWPDLNIRFFRKGSVTWSNKIHRPPEVTGKGLTLPSDEQQAIIHYHYNTLSEFLLRMNRYTDVQSKELKDSGYKFIWTDLINKPLGEFLGRYFANRGYEDGLHGLALSLLQAFSFLVMYLKIWEMEKFKTQEISLSQLNKVANEAGGQLNYWLKFTQLPTNFIKRLFQKARNKVI